MAPRISTDDEAIQSGSRSASNQLPPARAGGSGKTASAGVDPRLERAVDDTGRQSKRAADKTDDAIERTRKDSKGKTDIDEKGAGAVDGIGPALLSALGSGAQNALGPAGSAGAMPPMPQIQAASPGQAFPMSLSGPAAANTIAKLLDGGTGSTNNGGLKLGANSRAGAGGPTSPGGTEFQQAIIDRAKQIVAAGIPYSWGSGDLNGPTCSGNTSNAAANAAGDYAKTGFDCSALARYLIFQASGVEIPRTSQDQYAGGMQVGRADLAPGDLVFPDHSFRSGGPEHVQVYVGDGMVVEAQQSGTNVMFSNLPSGRYVRYVAG